MEQGDRILMVVQNFHFSWIYAEYIFIQGGAE